MEDCRTWECCDWDYACWNILWGGAFGCGYSSGVGCVPAIIAFITYQVENEETDATCCEGYCEVWDTASCGDTLG